MKSKDLKQNLDRITEKILSSTFKPENVVVEKVRDVTPISHFLCCSHLHRTTEPPASEPKIPRVRLGRSAAAICSYRRTLLSLTQSGPRCDLFAKRAVVRTRLLPFCIVDSMIL